MHSLMHPSVQLHRSAKQVVYPEGRLRIPRTANDLEGRESQELCAPFDVKTVGSTGVAQRWGHLSKSSKPEANFSPGKN